MRILDHKELNAEFPRGDVRAVPNKDLQRTGLHFKKPLPRTGGVPSGSMATMAVFLSEIVHWLPSGRARLLWISSFSGVIPSGTALIAAARKSLGETRPMYDAAGFYFENLDFKDPDYANWSEAQLTEMSWLVGLLAHLLVNQWDGYLFTHDP
jgi:hypothetical protein